MKYFDSHAHYYDERFAAEYPQGADDLLSRLFSESVSAIINIGTSPETSRAAAAQAGRFSHMYTAIGIHPTDGQGIADIDGALSDVERMIKAPENKCVAIGEIGLDYHYPDTDKEKQKYLFGRQMEMAARLGLPVCVHDRDAHGDVMETVTRHRDVIGVMHSFSGSAEMVRELMRLGWYVSFSGTVTFTNARRVREAAAAASPDRVLIETDAPYLAPHPLRGTCNHSGNLVYTNAALAAALGLTAETCAAVTQENAVRLFGITDCLS